MSNTLEVVRLLVVDENATTTISPFATDDDWWNDNMSSPALDSTLVADDANNNATVWNNESAVVYNTTNTNTTTTTTEELASDSEILRGTFLTYGIVFIVVALIFCAVRQRYPKAFNLRNWVEERKTDLAKDSYGFFSWVYHVCMVNDVALLDECGMDAVSFVRACTLGLKLCAVGMFCSIFLLPLYATAEESEETADITDNVVQLTTGHVGPGSSRLIATALASYIVFGACMYFIHEELNDWFLSMRYRFLAKPMARNYAIYLRNIPEHLQSNHALRAFFQRCLGGNSESLLEAHMVLKAANLQTEVTKRATTLFQLEHAVAEEEINGNRPTHTVDKSLIPGGSKGETVDSIDHYAKELKEQNEDITKRITKLLSSVDQDVVAPQPTAESEPTKEEENESGGMSGLLRSSVAAGASILSAEEDGQIFSAAFVVFSKLSNLRAMRGMSLADKPFVMESLEAPHPDDIYWSNVGRTHKDLQLGQLFSFAATSATCLLWTIPVAFVSSLSSVEALRSEVGFIDDMLDAAPFLVPVFEILAPQFLVILNALLPIILTIFAQLEGPISGAMVEASLFVKLSLFSIIQTFFVSALSGGILQELSNLIDDPTSIVNLLASSLPAQATFFMQLSWVMTVTIAAMEGLRIVPLIMALLRSCIGPNLTEKERSMPYFGLTPLNCPAPFTPALMFSKMVLFFIIFMVYAVIAPLVSFILALCFIVLAVLYRHQFVYIYSQNPDSGGFLYLNFIKILTSCLLIGEITVTGLLGLKKAAAATPLMIPLIIITILFNYYIRQKHFEMAKTLPIGLCLDEDEKNSKMDYSFVKGAYLQPEMQEKEVLPEVSPDKLKALGFDAAVDEEEGKADVAPAEKVEEKALPSLGNADNDTPAESTTNNKTGYSLVASAEPKEGESPNMAGEASATKDDTAVAEGEAAAAAPGSGDDVTTGEGEGDKPNL